MPQSKIVFQKDSVLHGSALKHSWGRNLFLFMWELQLVYTPFGGFVDADLINMQIAFDVSAQISIPITFISQDNCFSWINIKRGCQYFPKILNLKRQSPCLPVISLFLSKSPAAEAPSGIHINYIFPIL